MCPTNCEGSGAEPVCASNMMTFPNECELQKATCLDADNSPHLTVVFYGDCRERFSVEGTYNGKLLFAFIFEDWKAPPSGMSDRDVPSTCTYSNAEIGIQERCSFTLQNGILKWPSEKLLLSFARFRSVPQIDYDNSPANNRNENHSQNSYPYNTSSPEARVS